MVNVGGRSKGCSTCRKRRVKCDETHPVCARCQRWGYECDGPRGITFIEGKIVNSRRSNKSQTVSLVSENTQSCSVTNRQPLSPPLRTDDSEMCICYSRMHIRRGGAIDLVLEKTRPMDIIDSNGLAVDGHVFHQSILAFGTLLFGHMHGQTALTKRGYSMHGVALRLLNKALSLPDCFNNDDVVLSVSTLAILECLLPTGRNHYLKHMAGLERLLELRGPGLHFSPVSSDLYKSVRHMIIFSSLRTGKASIFSRPEWKSFLVTLCSEEEIFEQELYNVLADCTVLLERRNNLLNGQLNDNTEIEQRDQIEQAALDLLGQLQTWRHQWESDEKNSRTESTAFLAKIEPVQSNTSPALLTFYDFQTESAASMYLFFNTTIIHIIRLLNSLPPNFSDINAFDSHLVALSAISNNLVSIETSNPSEHRYTSIERLAALNICRSIPYYSAQKTGAGPHSSPHMHWAISTAWSTLSADTSPEGKWIMEKLSATSLGLIAKGLLNTEKR